MLKFTRYKDPNSSPTISVSFDAKHDENAQNAKSSTIAEGSDGRRTRVVVKVSKAVSMSQQCVL